MFLNVNKEISVSGDLLLVARLELARANPADFESAVSTDSTMPALAR